MSKLNAFIGLFVLVVLNDIVWVQCIVEYCEENTYAGNDTRMQRHSMQFTKEPTNNEYAIIGKFKGLHCCAKGYRSIEWYKDGMPYPWPGTASQMILYPESANQTIYTHSVTPEDSGNYTCLLSNDAVIQKHTIQLKVFDKAPDTPKITYLSSDTKVIIGSQARLFCEAFAGMVDLPDAHNEAKWMKSPENESQQAESRIRQEKVSREDGQTFGTYLIIDEVREEDFGQYVCKITKPGRSIDSFVQLIKLDEVKYINPNPVPWKKLLICFAIIALVAVTLFILNMRFGLSMRVRMKDRFGPTEMNDGKATDLLIVYAEKDAELALGVLLPTLESRYGYKCSCRVLPFNVTTWFTDLAEPAVRTRRLLAVMSPAALNDCWDAPRLCQAVKQLNLLGPRLMCIMLKEAPVTGSQIKDAQGQSLNTVLRQNYVLNWDRTNSERFWLSVRLWLPSKRCSSVADNQLANSSRLTTNTDSQESLDILV